MRIAENPNQASSVPEYLKPERLWLIPGKKRRQILPLDTFPAGPPARRLHRADSKTATLPES
jgi:hypothetical protein